MLFASCFEEMSEKEIKAKANEIKHTLTLLHEPFVYAELFYNDRWYGPNLPSGLIVKIYDTKKTDNIFIHEKKQLLAVKCKDFSKVVANGYIEKAELGNVIDFAQTFDSKQEEAYHNCQNDITITHCLITDKGFEEFEEMTHILFQQNAYDKERKTIQYDHCAYCFNKDNPTLVVSVFYVKFGGVFVKIYDKQMKHYVIVLCRNFADVVAKGYIGQSLVE